jgi:hypothetical protein
MSWSGAKEKVGLREGVKSCGSELGVKKLGLGDKLDTESSYFSTHIKLPWQL